MKYNIKFVEFTGGEPLEQSEVYVLMNELLDEGYEVAVETGGHINISNCDKRIIKIMDLKTPDSLMMKKNFQKILIFSVRMMKLNLYVLLLLIMNGQKN